MVNAGREQVPACKMSKFVRDFSVSFLVATPRQSIVLFRQLVPLTWHVNREETVTNLVKREHLSTYCRSPKNFHLYTFLRDFRYGFLHSEAMQIVRNVTEC